MSKRLSLGLPWLAPLCLAGLWGCVHGAAVKPVALSPAAQALANEAGAIRSITTEEDYFEAKLLFQALPENVPQYRRLRGQMLEYLLAPLASLDATRLRKDPSILGNEDDFDRLGDSFRDALECFPPASLWAAGGPTLTPRERDLLRLSAQLLIAVHSPRGNELPVATALFVLRSIDSGNPEWPSRLEQLFSWLEAGAQLARGPQGPRRMASPTDILESVASVWPTPEVVDRLSQAAFARQDKVTGILKRPIGTGEGVRGLLSELLIDTESLTNMAVAAGSLYVRCQQLARAAKVAERFADKPGDDPNFRQLVQAAAAAQAKAADLLALARRFLPRSQLLRGTSPDRVDAPTALSVLQRGLVAFPGDPDLLLLASRVARLVSAPLLSLRYLDEAIAVLTAQAASPDGYTRPTILH